MTARAPEGGGPVVIDADLVARLLAEQFPQWAGLPVRAASPQGWDNRTFRVGSALCARLPSGPGYAAQVLTEDRWPPHLAAHLPVPVPEPVALGRPGLRYPFAWSVRRWLDGEVTLADPASPAGRVDEQRHALAAVLQDAERDRGR